MWLKTHKGHVITDYQVAAIWKSPCALRARRISSERVSKDCFFIQCLRGHYFATKATGVDSSLGVQEEHLTSFFMPSDVTLFLIL
jgi:hypothetical protein